MSAEVKNEWSCGWSYKSTPTVCLYRVGRDKFTFFVTLVELYYLKAFVKPKLPQYISSFIEVTDNVGRINLLHANCEIKKEGH